MKFLEAFLPTLFITLLPSSEGVRLYAELRKKGKLKKRFDEENIAELSALEKRIRTFEKECGLNYVALLETEAAQGLLSNCRDAQGVELSSVDQICMDERWGLYMDKDDLFERQKQFKTIGLDFIFSPFSLLYDFFEQVLKERDGLFLLITGDLIVSAVFKESVMIYGEQIQMHEALSLVDETKVVDVYVEKIQAAVKAFYDAKVDETMFIEKVFMADGANFDTELENRLEEALFVEVERQHIDLAHQLVLLSEKELA